MNTRPIPTDKPPSPIDDEQLALLICGAAAWMQRDLILAMRIARENPSMGSPGIALRLRHLGHVISASTVRRILRANGIDPQPTRDHNRDWAAFLEAHADQIAAIDFTTLETLEHDGSLTTRYALFALHHDTRRVQLVGITTHPTSDWMAQMARNLTDSFDGFLSQRRFCIMDRDSSFSERFRSILANGGVRPIRTPPQSPNCNAIMERLFGSLKRECLRRIIPLGEIGLRHALTSILRITTPKGRTRVRLHAMLCARARGARLMGLDRPGQDLLAALGADPLAEFRQLARNARPGLMGFGEGRPRCPE